MIQLLGFAYAAVVFSAVLGIVNFFNDDNKILTIVLYIIIGFISLASFVAMDMLLAVLAACLWLFALQQIGLTFIMAVSTFIMMLGKALT